MAIVSYLAEVWARRVVPYLVNTLNWVQVGTQLRWVFRELALIVLLARVLSPSSALVAFAIGLMALHAVRATYSALAIYVTQCRTLPVVTRNVDLAALRIPDAPPPWLVQNDVQKLLYLDTIPVAGGLAAALTADFAWGFAGICAGARSERDPVCDHGRFRPPQPAPRRRGPGPVTVHEQIAGYRPEVVALPQRLPGLRSTRSTCGFPPSRSCSGQP